MRDAAEVKTHKLYYDDAYMRKFAACVTAVRVREEKTDIVLDQTAFFPEEGGQSPDSGTLAGFRVTDVQIEDGEIHHYIELPDISTADLAVGSRVIGEIDWPHRFANMQQHSGEHIVSGLVHRKYGFDNIGFHLSDREVTLDFDGTLTMEDLLKIENEANEAIYADIPSIVTFTTGDKLKETECRSKLDLEGQVRVVVFPGYDMCACCAPHVRHAGEIGIIKVLGAANYKGGTRVSILCGGRALRELDREHELIAHTARFLTTGEDEILPQVEKLKNENTVLKAALRESQTALLAMRLSAASDNEKMPLVFSENLDGRAMRKAAGDFALARSVSCGVFSGNDSEGYTFVIGAAGADAREYIRALRGAFQASGGGKPEMAQGQVMATENEIRALLS